MPQSPDLKALRRRQARLQDLLQRQEQKRGFLVAFLGPDGAGKTTQRKLFQKWLKSAGHEVVGVRWSASPMIKPLLKARKGAHALSPVEFCLLHAAAFRHQLEGAILPALWAGKMVIADGYVFSGVAADSARGVDLNWALNAYQPLFWPDMAFYFAVSPETLVQRLGNARPKFYEAGQDVTNLEDAEASHYQYVLRLNQEYSALAQVFRMVTLDAELSIYEQHRKIRQMFREGSRRPWAEWNREAVLEWLGREVESPEAQLGR